MKKQLVMVLSMCILLISFVCKGSSFDEGKQEANAFLTELQKQEWTYDATVELLGKSDSVFEGYELYHGEGISIRFSEIPYAEDNGIKGAYFSRRGSAENIIFDKKYSGKTVGGIKTGDTVASAVNKMGRPDFTDDELNVTGYKTEDLYVFLNGKNTVEEVSVYPIQKGYDKSTLPEAVRICENAEYSYETAVQVTNLFEKEWAGYNYCYTVPREVKISPRRGCVGMAYYSNGVKIFYSADKAASTSLISVYSNYGGSLPENSSMVTCYPDKDLVFETEKERLTKLNNFKARVKKEGKLSPDKKTLIVDNEDHNGIDIIFTDDKTPNFCLLTSPYQDGAGEWLNSRYFVYSYGKGIIMIYDLTEEKYAQLNSKFASIAEVGDTHVLLRENTVGESFIKIDFVFKENGDIQTVGTALDWENGVKEN